MQLYQLFVLRKSNSARFKLSNEVFNAMKAVFLHVSMFMSCKEKLNLCMNRESLENESLDRVSWTSSLIHQKNTFCKAYVIIFEPEIVSRKTVANSGRKSRQIEIPGEIYKKLSYSQRHRKIWQVCFGHICYNLQQVKSITTKTCSGVATGGEGARGSCPHPFPILHFNFWIKQGLRVSFLSITDIAF